MESYNFSSLSIIFVTQYDAKTFKYDWQAQADVQTSNVKRLN